MTQSPIARMQRQLGHTHPMSGLGYLGASLTIAGFGNTLTQEAVTGVKSGATAASISTAIGGGVASAIGAGAAAGSFVPIIGTAIGAIVGLVASGVFNHRVDPEVGNFNNAVALFHQNPQGIYNIADKYLVLAGLFDLLPGQIKGNIPIYKKYGRRGEQRFTQDMTTQVYNAAQGGVIGPNDTPATVMTKVVQPWIDSYGYGPMQDANGEMIQDILTGMVAEYVTGLWKKRWFARGGDMPNWQIPVFSLPAGAGVAAGPAGTPTQADTPPVAPSAPTQTGTPPPRINTPAPSPQLSSIPVPAGFTPTANNATSGAPVYSGPDARYYSWDGVSMSPFSGTLSAQGQWASVQNGTLTAPPSAPAQTASVSPALYGNMGYPPPNTPTVITLPGNTLPGNAPTQSVAGVSGSGLPPWLTWAAAGGVVLLLLATAHPVRGGRYKRGAS